MHVRVLGFFFFFYTFLVSDAYCIKVSGLNIEKIRNPQSHCTKTEAKVPTGDSPACSLDRLLEHSLSLDALIDNAIEITFLEEDSVRGSGSALTNTDLESVDDDLERIGELKRVKFALNVVLDDKELRWNHLREDEIPSKDAPEFFNKSLCSKLAKDAFRIANAHEHRRTRASTTCLCVVLRDKDQYAKKFVFHNGSDKMQASMAQKAQELAYAIRTGYQAHAEAAFMEFLLHRHKQNEARYTHVLGMGCSRQHCKECDCLLRLFLGKNYYQLTAAMCKEVASVPRTSAPTIEDLDQDEGDGVSMTVPAELQMFKVVDQVGAIEDKTYKKYRLSVGMQQEISNKASLPYLDFSDGRFQIATMVMKRSEKKRRIQDYP